MSRFLWITVLCALSAHAEEPVDKRSASQPGAIEILPRDRGLSTGLTFPADKVPKAWLNRLRSVRGAAGRVLVPTPLPAQAILVTGSTWYSLKWSEGDRHIILMVRYAGFRLPGFDASGRDAERMVIGRSHGLVSIDATLDGAAVTLDVECREPAQDEACSNDGSVRQRILNLAVVP